MGCECRNCKWYTEDAEVCVNDASDHLADFVMPDDGCEEWEGKDGEPPRDDGG